MRREFWLTALCSETWETVGKTERADEKMGWFILALELCFQMIPARQHLPIDIPTSARCSISNCSYDFGEMVPCTRQTCQLPRWINKYGDPGLNILARS